MKAFMLLCGIGIFGACGSGGGGAVTLVDTSSTPDSAAADASVAQDVPSDGATASDSGAPSDSSVSPEVVTGDKATGAPCAADAECVSGLCLSSPLGSACTVECSAEADCDALPIGMFCLPVRPGRSGCVPEASPAPTSCASHADCAFPLYCRPDDVGCDLPECLHGGDCAADEVCERATRRCQLEYCAADLDCRFPGQTCADDQTCAAPLCITDAECAGAPDYCHPIQRECKTPSACEDEDGCFYNEQCSDGFCLPDLCWNGCQGAEICDPSSGWCGAVCAGPGQGGCPPGEACRTEAGVCAPNASPVAVISGAAAVMAAVGASVPLSGADSVDPEGEALTYRWSLLAVPVGSGQVAGAPLGAGGVEVSFTPDVAGRFVIGLTTSDPAGVASIQAAVAVVAR